MGLISPGGETLLDILELRQVLLTYDGNLRDSLWWPQERPFRMVFHVGLSGFLSRRCWGLRPCVHSLPEPEDSNPVLTWNLGYFCSLPNGVSPRLELEHALGFLPDCSSNVPLPFAWIKGSVALPPGFPTRLSHRSVPRANVV